MHSATRCANCDITIDDDADSESSPSERDGKRYCCDGCADGGPCVC